MYKEQKYFILPEAQETIWRYMDFWKFKDLIETRSLFMPTIKSMGDEYEGKIPDIVRKVWVNDLKKLGYHSSANMFEMMGNYEPILKSNISSWNIAKSESYALWKIYTKDRSAIAIKSNISSLIKSLEKDNFWQHIGKVNYFDSHLNYNFDSNLFNLIMNKFDYYMFENELRIVNLIPSTTADKEEPESVEVRIKIDLDLLIESVYLAPNATEIEFENMNKFLEENNFKKDLFISGINDKWSNK